MGLKPVPNKVYQYKKIKDLPIEKIENESVMKIAIIGSGISGLYAGLEIVKKHQVTVYEKITILVVILTRMSWI
jgi:ribulose 1,5-bisphosphate synthetase/thiazole synthase